MRTIEQESIFVFVARLQQKPSVHERTPINITLELHESVIGCNTVAALGLIGAGFERAGSDRGGGSGPIGAD